MMRPVRACFGTAMTALLSGCINLAPHYHRAEAPVPTHWPVVDGQVVKGRADIATANLGWRDFIKDPRLQRVVAQALVNNRDLRVAVLDIEKARAEYRVQAAELFPSLDASATEAAARTPGTLLSTGESAVTHTDSVQLGFSSYQIDLFGKLHDLKQEEWETYLSTAETRRSTQLTLISTVAGDWLTLASDIALLQLARQTLRSEQATYDLTEAEHNAGTVSGMDLLQVQGAVASARKTVAADVTQVAQDRDALNLEVGATVADADLPDASMGSVLSVSELPAGIPSQVLLQRPDVLAAEHTLKAAYADIGAARAAFFPAITLTADKGTESQGLAGLFKRGSGAWSFEPSISLPIFDAGSNMASLKEAKATRDIDLADYEQTIQSAFKDVADVLATRASIGEQLDAQRIAVAADQRSYDLTMALYREGSDSMLDVLTTQRTLYTAQQTLISTELSNQTSLINLYSALGGGWHEYTWHDAAEVNSHYN
jgi:NodT family efflux transporter outer membrane factor (OMF) lipoprotein